MRFEDGLHAGAQIKSGRFECSVKSMYRSAAILMGGRSYMIG
jgi:hypothetical protein